MNLSRKIGRTAASLAVFLAALLAGAVPAPGASGGGSATVAASLADPSVDAGEEAEYHIEVVNGRADQPPPAPQVDGLTISYAGPQTSQQFSIDNFQMHRTITTIYVYRIETTRPGRFTIPGQDIEVNGASLRTLPITLTVLDTGSGGGAAAGQRVAVDLVIPKKSAYVGESIPAEVRSIFGLEVRFGPDPDPILNGEGFSVQKFAPPRNVETQVIDGVQVHVVTYKTALAGVRTGTLSVGPVELTPTVQMSRNRPRRRSLNDPFADPFFNGMTNAFDMAPPHKVKLRSDPVGLEIKPLPPGKPADFSGAIGDFRLEAEADPRKAQAGDPVTVRLVLSGRGNFDRIAAPVLADTRGLRTYPASGKFKADDDVNLSGIKTFEQVVIADGARASLPSYHFSYLDPSTGKYVALDTPPIPVEITGGNTPAPTTAPAAAVPANLANAATPTPTPEPSRPPKPAEDILYIRTDAGKAHTPADFLPPYRRPSFWLAQGAALAGLLALAALGVARARARNEKARRLAAIHRQQAEFQRALQREDTGRTEFYLAATQWARLKAAAVAGQPAGSLSVADICRAKGLDAAAAGSVEEIFHRHDELAYSGARDAREPVPADERRGVLATLETLKH